MKKNIKLLLIVLVSLVLFLPNAFALIPNNHMKIFAITSGDKAMAATLDISVVPGNGKIYSSIDESIIGNSTQESVKNAVSTLNLIYGNDVAKKYNYTVDIESNAYSVDGPSAGGAMALLMISMFEDLNITAKNISMTGSITNDGSIGNVGGIYKKAKEAANVGIKLFFIPVGNRNQVITDNNAVKKIDLIDYAYKNWGMKIVEVSNIKEVLKYSKMNISDIDINRVTKSTEDKYQPTEINTSIALNPMKSLVKNYLTNANSQLSIITNNLNDNNASLDESTLQNMLDILNYSKSSLKDAQEFYNNHYYYSAANSAFVTLINLNTINEIITTPSILGDSSTAFKIMLDNLSNKIKITENRSKLCSLDSMEWCIGAKQRLTWAQIKYSELIDKNSSMTGLEKINNYSYALAWLNIANDFLDISNKNSDIKFVEAPYFKDLAQQSIIDIENNAIINKTEANATDFKRRLESAKINFNRGWYVTSYYDSAAAKAVLVSSEENNNKLFDYNLLNTKYNFLTNNLKSISSLNSNDHIWSKLYFDHAMYYYNAYKYYKSKGSDQAKNYLQTTNSIISLAYNLYNAETKVINYYNTADIQVLIQDTPKKQSKNVFDTNYPNSSQSGNKVENIYVYSKSIDSKYIILALIALFLIVITIVVDVERYRKRNKKDRIKKEITYLDEELLDGRVSPFTYKEMRSKYLKELSLIKQQDSKKKKKSEKPSVKKEHIDSKVLSVDLEEKIIDKQIAELERRKKELIKNSGSKSIRKVKSVVKKIKEKPKPKHKSKLKIKKNI